MPDFDAFARYYDADMGDVSDDLAFYRELARRTGGPVLDAMCGTGRVIAALGAAGYDSVGLDVSAAMLAVARDCLRARALSRVSVVQGDIRDFSLEQRFGLILVPMNSLMHLETIADQLAALRMLRQHLAPGGRLVIDLFNPVPAELNADQGVLVFEHSFRMPGGATVQKYVLRHTDVATQTHQVQFMYDELSADGIVRRTVLPFTMRWLYRYEAEHLLARTGWIVDNVYGSYDLDPYQSDSAQLLLVARGDGA